MNDADFTEMLEARLRLTYHDVAVATPRPRYAAGRAAGMRRALRVPALLATPVIAFSSVAVVAGASTVAKTVVTGDPNPLDWGSRHAVVVPPLPVPPPPAAHGAGTGDPDRAHPAPHPGRGGGAAAGNGHAPGDGGTGNDGNKQPGSHSSGGPGSDASAHGKSGKSS